MPFLKVISSVVIIAPHVLQAIIAIIRLLIQLKDKRKKKRYTKKLRTVIKQHIKSDPEPDKPVAVELNELKNEISDAVEQQDGSANR